MGTGLSPGDGVAGRPQGETIRLLADPPRAGVWNMGFDEALFQIAQFQMAQFQTAQFQTAQGTRQRTLRLYQWNEPTVTLGYFQEAAERSGHSPSGACPFVRRSTGGGAIVHDVELTYSLVTPLEDERAVTSLRLVQAVHGALIDALASLGVVAAFHDAGSQSGSRVARNGSRGAAARGAEPFLCFQRRTAEDVVVDGWKVAGSAQRKLHRTLLQHGSILLGSSACAPELPGIGDLRGHPLTRDELEAAWLPCLAARLTAHFEPGVPTPAELDLAQRIEQDKFRSDAWNRRR